jgi:ketoreductase
LQDIALITGASGGIGRSISKNLLDSGHSLILVGRDQEKLDRFVDVDLGTACRSNIETYSCDVSQTTQVSALIESIQRRHLEISILVNAAGVSGGGITADIDDELWLSVIGTNLNGTFFVTREVLRLGLMREGGRIINIASTGGKQGVIHGSPYCASKHGLVGFTKALGLELARNGSGITVNAICPGFVETEMAERVRCHYARLWGTDEAETRRRIEERVPIGRYIEPDEVSAMVAYVASPLAAGVTAQALNVCGGLGNY